MPPSDSEADELPPLPSELATPISENRTVSDQQQTPRAGPVARSRAPLPSSSVLSDLPSTLSSGEESAEDEDNIVTSTVEHWRKLRRKHSTSVHPVAYNISAFLEGYIKHNMRAESLAAALRQPDVRAALSRHGITILAEADLGSQYYDVVELREELKALQDHAAFNTFDYEAHRASLAAQCTIRDVCNSAWVSTCLAMYRTRSTKSLSERILPSLPSRARI